MPTTYTHRRFARDVMKKYPDLVNIDTQDKQNLFYIGTHGPDITFYYQLYKPNGLSRVGYRMHDRFGDDLFKEFAQIYHQRNDNPNDLAYLLGFLCHFALDSAAHPTVYRYQETDNLTHSLIEMQLDRFFLQKDGISDPTQFDTISHIHPTLAYGNVIAPYFEGFDDKKMFVALKDMVHLHHLFYCKSDLKRNIVRGVTGIPKNKFIRDIIFIKEDLPCCKQSNLDLLNCYTKALDNIAIMIENYLQYLQDDATPLNPLFHHDFEKL